MDKDMKPIITVRHLHKEYVTYNRGSSLGDTIKSFFHREKVIVDAVKDISFDIEQGSIVGILGKNGAGKSTTIKMLTGVLLPSSGKIDVMGYAPYENRSRYVARIGAVFGQKSQLIWDIPPMDSFLLNKAIYDIPDKLYHDRLELMTELLDVGDVVKRPTRVLSLGERMKCEFMMAMLHDPAVVFLDEPTIGLDLLAKESIRGFIGDMNRKGTTFILTTHDMADVEKLAHRVIIINKGEKVFEDTLPALKRYLGDKKHVTVVMKKPLAAIDLPGVQVKSGFGQSEIELLVDNGITSMSRFMASLQELGEILDLSIKEPDMEEIIKAIYVN